MDARERELLKERLSRGSFLRLAGKMAGACAAWAMLGMPLPPAATSANAEQERLFDKLMVPFINESGKRRASRRGAEADYDHRVDLELNDGRVNFLMFGQGETFEPPFEKVGIIGSHTILSYDTRRKAADIVSITHDTRAPEIERYLMQLTGEQSVTPIKIDQAYQLGATAGGRAETGFALQRQVLENATGLSMDFQVTFWDDAVVDLVNNVFGKVKVKVPKTFNTNPFYFKGKRYPVAEFPAGEQHLDGLQAIQFIKTVVIEDTERPDPELEHNARKHLLFRSMFEQWKGMDNALTKTAFLGKLAVYVVNSVRNSTITYDFDSTSLLVNNIQAVADGLKTFMLGGGAAASEPEVGQTVYIVDYRHGDGGVQWVRGNNDPLIREEFERGVYIDPAMEVAVGGNPYAEDLVGEYWPAVRSLVRSRLMG